MGVSVHLPPDYYGYLKPLLFKLPAETAHNLAIALLKRGLPPALPDIDDDALSLTCCGMALRNPVGLAAGFDKNAAIFSHLYRHGFGFAEIGTLTLKAQKGNPKPRIFRLEEDHAIINRLGFNNKGMEYGLYNIARQEQERCGMLGINIGKNRDTPTDKALDDYIPLLNDAYGAADYITINISSPNTKDLRELQREGQIGDFLKAIMAERNGIAAYNAFKRPVFVKISPDINDDDLDNLLDQALAYKVDGLIVSNTTIARSALKSGHASQTGGLSGAPLTYAAHTLLSDIYKRTKGALPLIAAGGIMSSADAVARIRAGATLIQLYSGLIYRGLGLVQEIKQALLDELQKEQLLNVEALIGIDNT